jgi:hypothetical protein
MKAFTCPQCGASLEYERIASATVKCYYCNSVVIVPADLRPEPRPLGSHGDERPGRVVPALIIAAVLAGAIGLLVAALSRSSGTNTRRGVYTGSTPRPPQTPQPTPKPDGYTIALSFGAEGNGPGFFADEMMVAVSGDGHIYVSDDTLRVQRFDPSGRFLNTWNIPRQTKWYNRFKGWPEKLLVNGAGDLYAVMAGVLMKFDGETGEVLGAAHGSDRIYDAALVPGGGQLLMVSEKAGRDDELVLLGGDGRVARRTHRFVSSLLDKDLEVAALRVAADGAGHVYAIYCIGGLYGEHSYDDEDLAVFKFSPEGKYLTRFGSGGSETGQFGIPAAFAVDHQGRVYICELFNRIHVYTTGDGRYLRTLTAPHAVKSLVFDSNNALFIAGANRVSKLVLDQ